MNTQPARLTSSHFPGLRQLAARSVAPALLFPSACTSRRAVEAGAADHAFSSIVGACPGLTLILIRCGKRTSVADRAGSTHPRLPVKFSPRANAGFKARHHSRRNTVQSFPSHGARTSFATSQGSEGAFAHGKIAFAGKANG